MSSTERILGLGKLQKNIVRRSIATIVVSQTSVEYIKHIRRVDSCVELLRERKSEFVEYLSIYRTSILDKQVRHRLQYPSSWQSTRTNHLSIKLFTLLLSVYVRRYEIVSSLHVMLLMAIYSNRKSTK